MPHKGKPVVIPPELPEILKKFTKDAIRTQPEDLIEWSAVYFYALVQGQPLPVREITEKIVTPSSMDLTPEILTSMHSQLCTQDTVTKQEIKHLWKTFSLADDLLEHICSVGSFGEEIDWIKFFALGCSYLGGTIKNAMTHACYILNSDQSCHPPDACIPFEKFRFLYTYLAAADGEVCQAQVDRALTYLETTAKAANGLVKVSDFINSRKVRLG